MDEPGAAVEFDLIGNKLFIIDSVNNSISNAGCKWLSKADRKKSNFYCFK